MSDEVRILHGDCLELLPTLADGSVDCVITDPPFGKAFHDGGLSNQPRRKWSNPTEARFTGVAIAGDAAPDTRSLADMARVMKVGAAAYLFSQWMVEQDWIEACENVGLTIRNRLIWHKPMHGAGDVATTYGPQHESIIFATKGRHELRGRRDGDVWMQAFGFEGCFAGRKGKLHPNQKPISLIRWLIEKSSRPGDLILDPFAGSGTTGIAALKAGRRCILIECEAAYVEVIHRRIAESATPLFDSLTSDLP